MVGDTVSAASVTMMPPIVEPTIGIRSISATSRARRRA
jgi:hypothetical protein